MRLNFSAFLKMADVLLYYICFEIGLLAGISV